MENSFGSGTQQWNGRGTTSVDFTPFNGTSGPGVKQWVITNSWGSGIQFNVQYSGGQSATFTFDTSSLPASTVAITYYIPDRDANNNLTGFAAAALTLLNTQGTTPNGAPTYDPNGANFSNALESLGGHESGHGLGLGDQTACGDVMSPWGSTNNQAGCAAQAPSPCDDTEITNNPNTDYAPPPVTPCPQACSPAMDSTDTLTPIDWCTYPNTGCPGNETANGATGCCANGTPDSPILIDTSGWGFFLTDAKGGVLFDILGTGRPIQIAWTAPGAQNAFLCLPDASGNCNSGKQLFGNVTPQPASSTPNGFAALAVYDSNGDGVIDAHDAIFSSLRLWIDANHDGISQPNELFTLPALGITSISLNYRWDRRTDRYGNVFRYRAQVGRTDGTTRMAYDVFFVTVNTTARATPNANTTAKAALKVCPPPPLLKEKTEKTLFK